MLDVGDMGYHEGPDLSHGGAGCPPRRDFTHWNYLTDLVCSPEDMSATHDYGIEQQRRAWELVAAAQDQRENQPMSAAHKARQEEQI